MTDTPKAHRHRWERANEIRGQVGLTYVWWRCGCGLRRVDTMGAVGRVKRRYEPKRER